MIIKIKSRFSDVILFEGEYESTKKAVEAANLGGANLGGADLGGANLYGANLYEANLGGANLGGANLGGANLGGANLGGANLRGANLYGANLYGANLGGADLGGADLYGANLGGADLRGADLGGANLRGANLRGEILKISPLFIQGLRWDVTITAQYLTIGCQRHTHEEWVKFKRTDITPMEDKAYDWWKIHKPILLGLCEVHKSEANKIKDI